MVVEFLEYHVMQGVQHFYLGVDYKWGSRDMARLQVRPTTTLSLLVYFIFHEWLENEDLLDSSTVQGNSLGRPPSSLTPLQTT